MILKAVVLLIMFAGLIGTLIPKIPGTLIIISGSVLYSLLSQVSFSPILAVSLIVLSIIAEVGGRLLRYYLVRKQKMSVVYSTNSTVGNMAGLIVADALFGSVIGMAIWELIIGKTWIPKGKDIAMVLAKTMAAACVRLICGFVMIILIVLYLFV